MANLQRVLAGCEHGLGNVISARTLLLHFSEDHERMNAAYETYFAPRKWLARTCVVLNGLARNALIEIDLVARFVTD